MTLIREAYFRLFEGTTDFPYEEELEYSGKFRGYNANARLSGRRLEFKLSKKWKDVSRDIQVGLVQQLLLKLLRRQGKKVPKTTLYIELYHYFLRGVHRTIVKTKSDPILEHQFGFLNEKYFAGTIELPNLKWGQFSTRTLGHYEYGTDTLTISKALHPACDCPEELLQYVIYHEMLHKKHKFKGSHSRTYAHTPAFRADERKFPDAERLEKEMNVFAQRQKRRRGLLSFF